MAVSASARRQRIVTTWETIWEKAMMVCLRTEAADCNSSRISQKIAFLVCLRTEAADCNHLTSSPGRIGKRVCLRTEAADCNRFGRIIQSMEVCLPPHGGGVLKQVRLRICDTGPWDDLFRILRRLGLSPSAPKEESYKPKPYEQMTYPGQRVQVGVKAFGAAGIASLA